MMTETLIFAPFTTELEAYLKKTNMDYDKNCDGTLTIHTTDYIAPDCQEVDPLIIELLKYINKDCVIEGFYDAYEANCASLKFCFEYKAGTLKKFYSDWVRFLCADCFSEFDDFCEIYEERFTEEEYEAFCEEDYYLLDGGDGDAVLYEEIPMTEYPLNLWK